MELPRRLQSRPTDARGYVVPWFVPWVDGVPMFPAMKPEAPLIALGKQICWVCGKSRQRTASFVIGPMCAINRVSSEPPSHSECAIYSAITCPFLSKPRQRRAKMSDDLNVLPNEYHIDRNPGVALVWESNSWRPFYAPNGQLLFNVGEPLSTLWFAHGRPASREEVLDSIDSGYPILAEQALRDPGGLESLADMRAIAESLVPA